MNFFSNFSSCHLIAAHRGFRGRYPENSQAAFHGAIGLCDFIELDIQLSRDKIPMVIHDPTLLRTSDANLKETHSLSWQVCDWTASNLKTLDIGSWFLKDDPFHTVASNAVSVEQLSRLMPQRILTLGEYLRDPKLKHIPVNIEIKDQLHDIDAYEVSRIVVSEIEKAQAVEMVLISSFNHDYLRAIKELNSALSTAVLVEISHPAETRDYVESLGACAYHIPDVLANDSIFAIFAASDIAINVYTINSTTRQFELFRMGAKSVFTDFPHLL